MDAIRLLEQGHHQLEQLFDQFERASEQNRQPLVQRICNELLVHAQIEQEIFYPAVRSGLGQDGEDLVEESLTEHQQIGRLVDEVRRMSSSDQTLSAKLTVLMEEVRHHVDEEESEMFPDRKSTRLNSSHT